MAADVAAQGRGLRLHPWRPRRRGRPAERLLRAGEGGAGPLGVEPSWSFKYNGGANPIAFPIGFQHAGHSKVLGILEQAYALA